MGGGRESGRVWREYWGKQITGLKYFKLQRFVINKMKAIHSPVCGFRFFWTEIKVSGTTIDLVL